MFNYYLNQLQLDLTKTKWKTTFFYSLQLYLLGFISYTYFPWVFKICTYKTMPETILAILIENVHIAANVCFFLTLHCFLIKGEKYPVKIFSLTFVLFWQNMQIHMQWSPKENARLSNISWKKTRFRHWQSYFISIDMSQNRFWQCKPQAITSWSNKNA